MQKLLVATNLVVVVALSACSKKTEDEALADMRDSFAYKQYALLSSNGLALGLKAYQSGVKLSKSETMPELSDKDLCIARVFMAYGALISDKRTIALVESDIVDKNNCDVFMRAAGSSLRSVVFHREEWPGLAATETAQSKTMLASARKGDESAEQLLAFHLALGVAAVRDKDFAQAQVHIDAVGLQLEAPWLGLLGKATIDIQQGNVTDGLRGLKRLSEDQSVPAGIRDELVKGIANIETKAGNVDAPGFAARLLVNAIWQLVKEQSSAMIASTVGFVEEQLTDKNAETEKP